MSPQNPSAQYPAWDGRPPGGKGRLSDGRQRTDVRIFLFPSCGYRGYWRGGGGEFKRRQEEGGSVEGKLSFGGSSFSSSGSSSASFACRHTRPHPVKERESLCPIHPTSLSSRPFLSYISRRKLRALRREIERCGWTLPPFSPD